MQSLQANRGRTLEDLVEMVFDCAGTHVKILRQTNKWVPLRSGKAFPAKGAPIDFLGVINGFAVAIECKESSQSKLSMGRARFPQKEIDALRDFVKAGGNAYVVAAFWRENLLAIYRFSEFYQMWSAYKNKKRLSYVMSDNASATISINDAQKLPIELDKLTHDTGKCAR